MCGSRTETTQHFFLSLDSLAAVIHKNKLNSAEIAKRLCTPALNLPRATQKSSKIILRGSRVAVNKTNYCLKQNEGKKLRNNWSYSQHSASHPVFVKGAVSFSPLCVSLHRRNGE